MSSLAMLGEMVISLDRSEVIRRLNGCLQRSDAADGIRRAYQDWKSEQGRHTILIPVKIEE